MVRDEPTVSRRTSHGVRAPTGTRLTRLVSLYTTQTRTNLRQYYHTDKPVRASLEVLGSSLPDAGHAELDECTRETEAVKALTCLLWEEGRQLEDQGKPQAAEEKFERANRAKKAWMHCNVDVLDAFVKYPYEIGETEEADTWMREARSCRIRARTRLSMRSSSASRGT